MNVKITSPREIDKMAGSKQTNRQRSTAAIANHHTGMALDQLLKSLLSNDNDKTPLQLKFCFRCWHSIITPFKAILKEDGNALRQDTQHNKNLFGILTSHCERLKNSDAEKQYPQLMQDYNQLINSVWPIRQSPFLNALSSINNILCNLAGHDPHLNALINVVR